MRIIRKVELCRADITVINTQEGCAICVIKFRNYAVITT